MFSIDSASSIDDASMYGVHAYNSNSKGGGIATSLYRFAINIHPTSAT